MADLKKKRIQASFKRYFFDFLLLVLYVANDLSVFEEIIFKNINLGTIFQDSFDIYTVFDYRRYPISLTVKSNSCQSSIICGS